MALNNVEKIKYLGITITNDLNEHSSAVFTKKKKNRTIRKDRNWHLLDQRGIDSCLVMMYKVTYDLIAISASVYLIHNTRQSRHIHTLSYMQIPTFKDYCRFSPRSITHWNALPAHIPVLCTLELFSSTVC